MKPEKFLIFDAGPIISLTMNGLLDILEKLKQNFNGKFIVTPQVKKEIIDRPSKIKKYELEAVRVKNLFDKGVLTDATEFVSVNFLKKETKKALDNANKALKANQRLNLIHEGEASCLAFSKICNKENVIVIDERTTRMISEDPEALQHLMEKKLHTKITLDNRRLKILKGFKFIRSSELLYIAYKKNLFEMPKTKQLLDALLYGVKYKGTAISSKEIEDIKKLK